MIFFGIDQMFYWFRRELNEHKKLHHANSRMNTPRVQLSSPLKTSETPSQNVLDEHVDSQQHG